MNYKRRQPPPEELIGPRVNFLSRLIRCRFNEVIAEQGLYSGQQDIIFALIENEGITSSKLAQKTGVSNATMSVSIKRMEKAGFVYHHNTVYHKFDGTPVECRSYLLTRKAFETA